jgi:hypothetical protein
MNEPHRKKTPIFRETLARASASTFAWDGFSIAPQNLDVKITKTRYIRLDIHRSACDSIHTLY